MSQRIQSKYWVFTINNEGSEVPRAWEEHVTYCVWQRESGENGTPHLQGYVILKSIKDLTWLKRHLSDRAHWEKRRGKHAEAKAYCMKDDTRIEGPFEIGQEPPESEQGKRTDIARLKRALDEGQTELEIADDPETFGLWLRHQRCITRYRTLKRAGERTWHTHCLVLWGPPGVGKSRRALEEAGEGAYWLRKPQSGGTVWFDGYDGQEVVVIDEFYGWIARDLMQRMCDRYPMLVDTKGGSTVFLAKRIIITSNEHPNRWWPKVGLGAMTRRLTGECGAIVHMTFPQDEASVLVPSYPKEARYWEEFIDVISRDQIVQSPMNAQAEPQCVSTTGAQPRRDHRNALSASERAPWAVEADDRHVSEDQYGVDEWD